MLAGPANADTIVLTNGRVIEAERAWYEGNQVRYQKDGGVYGLPRTLVQRVELRASPAPAVDPDVVNARARLAAQDPVEAVRLLRLALARDPRSLAAHHGLVDAYLALGDTRAAVDVAARAVRVDPRDPVSRARLGDAHAAAGDRAAAEAEYRRSLLLRPDAEVQRKLSEVAPPPTVPTRGAQFRLRYEGGLNEPLGMAVLEALSRSYDEHARRLGFRPEEPILVVLEMGRGFEERRVPDWSEGIYDGTIRVPVMGLEAPSPRLLEVLRHELGHSFVAYRTGGNCPTWLQEGVSRWLEGGDPAREDAAAARALREGRLLPLLTLEAPFQTLPPDQVALAYSESLSAVAHILRRKGEPGLVRLLAALGDRLPSDEALPVALALGYPELQRSWEEHLRSLPR